jgi:hypothetical protein
LRASAAKQSVLLASQAASVKPAVWNAEDDFKLIANVEQVPPCILLSPPYDAQAAPLTPCCSWLWQSCDLVKVHQCVRFSQQFTLKQVMRRWHALLYDEETGRCGKQAQAAQPAGGRRPALGRPMLMCIPLSRQASLCSHGGP